MYSNLRVRGVAPRLLATTAHFSALGTVYSVVKVQALPFI